MLNIFLLIYGLLAFQSAVFCERIQLQNIGGYELDNFRPGDVMPLMYKEKGLLTKDIPWSRARFEISGNFTSASAKPRAVTIVDMSNRSDMAVLTTPDKRIWIGVTRTPSRVEEFMLHGKKVGSGASVNIENGQLVNNFVIVAVDWKKLDESMKEGDSFIPLKTIWDPSHGVQNAEFQKDLCGWLSALEPEIDFSPLCILEPTVSTAAGMSEPMSEEEARKLTLSLTELAASLLGLSSVLR